MSSQPANAKSLTTDTITVSGRWAFLGLLGGAALWLAIAGVLGLIASVKMHSPTLLADCAWFSYGRLKAAAGGAFNFGFATQAAIAIALWLAAVLGRTTVKLPFLGAAASKAWNVGVLLGVAGILYGDGTGIEGLEFPRYAVGVLLFAFIGLALPVFVTFHNRTVRELYPSLWFVIAGMFWFAWLFSSASLLLHFWPVRGVLQAAVQGWFNNGFVVVWLFPIAIALLLYLRPALSGVSIPSRATVLLAFWSLAFIGPWGGIATGTPLPAWVGALSTSMSSLIVIPIFALCSSVGGLKPARSADPFAAISWKFADFSFLALVLFGVLTAINSFTAVYRLTQFTFVTAALQSLALYGVVLTALLAGAFQILPKLAPSCGMCARVAGLLLWITRSGITLLVISLLLAGLRQGRALATAASFTEVTAVSKMWFRMSTLGDLLFAASGLIFLAFVSATIFRTLKAEYASCAWCGAGAKTTEVAS